MSSAATTIAKIEGWKYSPLFAVEQKKWTDVEFKITSKIELQQCEKASVLFDNAGDLIIADRILTKVSLQKMALNADESGQEETVLEWRVDNGTASAAMVIDVNGKHPVTFIEHGIHANGKSEFLQKIYVHSGAHLTHIRVVESDDQSVIFAPVFVSVEGGGVYRQLILSRGALLARLTVQGELLAETAHIDLRAVHQLCGDRHVDQAIVMKHLAPHCTSNQNIRVIVEDEARAAFQGKIHVAQVAQKTLAYQLCKSMILSDGAQMNTKPELEIFADDVKCSHGATTGALDERALFYLQSRGIPRGEAQKLLRQAFIEDVLEDFHLPVKLHGYLS